MLYCRMDRWRLNDLSGKDGIRSTAGLTFGSMSVGTGWNVPMG